MLLNDTIASISTPPGRGGIAVIRISGPEALPVAARVFMPQNNRKKIEEMPGYTAAFGHMVRGGQLVDEGVALVFRAPHSYTGEDVAELSCHGGELVSRQVLLACLEAGAAPAQPGEFTRRAVLNGRLDLAQAEAVMEVINANSRQNAALAQAHLGGALHRKIQEQKEKLLSLAAHLTAMIDFPEEDVEDLTRAECADTVRALAREMDAMIRESEKGAVLRRGIKAVIAGSPNVGKSTLFNMLAGFERAIVTPVPGTTRDTLFESVNIAGLVLHLADTAGIHQTEDLVETEGIRRSLDEMEAASLVVAVFDGSQPLTATDRQVIDRCAGKRSLAVLNKNDLQTVVRPEDLAPHFTKVLSVSAKSPDARGQIEEALEQMLGIDELDPNLTVLAGERQLAAASAARTALRQADEAIKSGVTYDAVLVLLDEALEQLGSLTGEDTTEAVLDQVFENFCVGK